MATPFRIIWEPLIASAWLLIMFTTLAYVCGHPVIPQHLQLPLLALASFVASGLCLQGMWRSKSTIGFAVAGSPLGCILLIDGSVLWGLGI